MKTSAQPLTFTMSIPLHAHQAAQKFWGQQSSREKGKQVYLNTIAIQVVHEYLKCFGIETDLAASDSWNPVLQVPADTADLMIKNQGQLECRPVLPGQEFCPVPSEVWHERIGYVAVQLNAELTEATLLGFLPRVNQVEVPLKSWQSLEQLLDHLVCPLPVTVHLSQWMQGIVETGWQTLDALFNVPQPVLVSRSIQAEASSSVSSYTIRGKLLPLEPGITIPEIALVVEVLPVEPERLEITVKLCPKEDKALLPNDLDIMVLDEEGSAVMQAQSRNTEMIQLQFLGSPGERFSIKTAYGVTNITESFIV
jgi:Protein of unknown function (DUF1822)